MAALFAWPDSAAVRRVVPKSTIYTHAGTRARMQRFFREEVETITWAWKLFEGSVNLPAADGIEEIEVFEIALKTDELSDIVLVHLDKAIPHPAVFELVRPTGQVQVAAAFKRPSAADKSKWVTDAHYRTVWLDAGTERTALPTALTLAHLYAGVMQAVWPYRALTGETLSGQAARLAEIKRQGRVVMDLTRKLGQERQFNRRVELHETLQNARAALSMLTHGHPGDCQRG